jgi:multiple sugar transport system substrate-binding protein
VATAIVLVAALGLTAAALAARSTSAGSTGPTRATKGAATELTIWVGFSAGHELKEVKKVIAEYDNARPDVSVKVVGGINDDKIIAAIRAGKAPDVVSSFMSTNVGIYCPSGGWIDLAPYLARDKIDTNIFPATSRYYTQYKGKRCALPMLADAVGLYYNTTLFKQAGLKGPPKTMSQLAAYAKKLTQKNADGTFKIVGYDPNLNFYHAGYGNGAAGYQPLFGTKYFSNGNDGKSSLSTDPGWAKLFRWQKSLIDFYGYDKLVRWQAGAGDEFAPSHPFQTGKLAMMLDGEWRVAFLKNEHPELKYATAPMPVDDAHPELYGAGAVNGTIIGIPKNGKNREQAWALVRYLTTNDHALARLSNGIRNVPSTVSSSKSRELVPDKNFATFLKIFTHPRSTTTPITPIGADHLTTITNFIVKWQAGKLTDLQGGLRDVDKTIDAKIKQSQGGGGVP